MNKMENPTVNRSLRSTQVSVPIVGSLLSALKPYRIPTKREALQVIFFYNYVKHHSIAMSITDVTELILQLKIVGHTIKRKDAVKASLQLLYEEWRNVQRSKNKKSSSAEEKKKRFINNLSDPLPCAVPLVKDKAVAVQVMKVNELADKRESDKQVSEKENESDDKATSGGKINITTPRVAAAFERTGISNRNASFILEAIVEDNHTMSPNKADYAINYQTIRRSRMKHREELAEQLMQSFDPDVPLVIHWDGKMLPNIDGKRVDRLPIVVTGAGISKLLSVPSLTSGTACAETTAIMDTIKEWGLQDRIIGMSFDTTSVNSGSKTGIISRLPVLLQKNLLSLACRHHVAEIVLKHVFEIFGDKSKSSNLDAFSAFKKEFNEHQTKRKFMTVMHDPQLKALTDPWRDTILQFCNEQLKLEQQRGDYEELLELVVMFLGGVPPKGQKFRKAGCLSRARWMARGIYVLKLWMCSDAVEDTALQSHYTTVALFISQCFVRYWYRVNSSVSAPRVDLEFWADLNSFHEKSYASVAMTAFKNHLWYLSEWNVAMAFFDVNVEIDEKKKMVAALKHPRKIHENPRKRRMTPTDDVKVPVKAVQIDASSISSFVTEASSEFFTIMKIPTDFLDESPEIWDENPQYLAAQERVKALVVVNDVAERAVKLVTDYNNKITKDPEQHNYLLQVVEYHRKIKPLRY